MNQSNFSLNEIIAVYTDTNGEWFGAGAVCAVNDYFVVIESVDVFGENDGLTLYRLNEIVKIEKDTLYLNRIKKFINIKKTVFNAFDITDEDYDRWFLKKSNIEQAIVQVQLLQSGRCDITGIVKTLNDNSCIITQIDEQGINDGEVTFALEDISSIKINSRDSYNLKLLRESNV